MNKFIVIGSGVMGSGIAAQIANSGFKVALLDIVLPNSEDRNILANQAIEKLGPSLEDRISLITPGNIEDDIEVIKEADWIIEVIVEKLDVKQSLYKKLDQYAKHSAIISSNTSTLPLSDLINGMSESFKSKFMITHFFNPPRFMPLLELVTSKFTDQTKIKKLYDFMDINLGKAIVISKDTPGFIANRIGCYWLEAALTTAIEMNVSVEEADYLINKPLGIPSTAVFGLYDLIGIDVMRLISNSLKDRLNKDDDFFNISKSWPLISKMIEDGYTGRKGKGGFYKITKDNLGNKRKEVIDLQSGEYHLFKENKNTYTNAIELLDNSIYATKVMCKTLSYAVNLLHEVSDSLYDIDTAMKLGYNWKYGPFELIDLIGIEYFRNRLKEFQIPIPQLILDSGNKKFYQPSEVAVIKPFLERGDVSIWNAQNDVAIIELTSKMGILTQDVFNAIDEFYTKYASKYRAVVIVNKQSNFSVGGDLKFMLEMAEQKNFTAIDDYLKLGQSVMMQLKYSPIPVVAAVKGMALGGGCEILLHSHKVVAHVESHIGLVETGVGIIPSWGGCKELIARAKTRIEKITAFKNILFGMVSTTAHKFPQVELVMNPNRVLEQSENIAIKLANIVENNFICPEINVNWQEVVQELSLEGYNRVIAEELIGIFSLNSPTEQELLDAERRVFIKLLHNQGTIERIKYMLKKGKRLAN